MPRNPVDGNGSRIGSFHAWPRQTADLHYAGMAHNPAHKVDGGLPAFQGAAVDYKTLTLTFTANLDGDSIPAPGAFRVTVNNARRGVASGGVNVSGQTVTLTLASAVTSTDTVKVRYTRPTRQSRCIASHGKAVDTFADQDVTVLVDRDLWSATLTSGTSRDFFHRLL